MDIIKELYSVVIDRKNNPEEGSYTNYLLNKGTEKIAKKVGEEAVETAIAAAKKNKQEVIGEIGDVVYHMLVLMADLDISLEDVEKELRSRR
ncbi:MAG: phosphoribosyl-ATP diphosphatase [Saccharofermentans sp.]|nr:phosphoribosyl-ATP diphosphatase [Saccharofermentans sp.]MCQ2532721.1 phosphoribosyl-ATP diphosphatase [Saccharofermentans sp.]